MSRLHRWRRPVLTLAALAAWAGPGFAASPLDYREALFESSLAERGAREFDVSFPSPLKSPFPANDTVWGRYWLPAGAGPHPAVLVLGVMAASNDFIEMRFVRRLVKDGFAVLLMETPYQFRRRPDPLMPSGQVFLARTAPALARNFRQAALDARRSLSWLAGRGEVDRRRIGLLGVSLGALVSAAVYSVDATPRYAVFMLGGADFPALALESGMTGPFIRQAGIRPEELRKAWKGIDPTDYVPANLTKPALLINAVWDRVIPRRAALALRHSFPAAEQTWVPLGHYASVLHLMWVPRYVSRRLRENL